MNFYFLKKNSNSLYLEFFNTTEINIKDFKSNYIVSSPPIHSVLSNTNISVNMLNEYGLLTYSLNNRINLDDEFSINVDNYRQNFFYEVYL